MLTLTRQCCARLLSQILATLNPGGIVDVVKGKILIKRLQTMLHCRNLTAAQTIGVITPEGCFVLYLRLALNVGTMTYYLPLVAADDDEGEA